MDGFREDLHLEGRPSPGRVSAPGVSVAEVDEIEDVETHWAQDDEMLAALFESARAFAIRERPEFEGPLLAYFLELVKWLKEDAPHGLRTMSHESPMTGCAAESRRRVGSGKM
jgi:hypothetical protein